MLGANEKKTRNDKKLYQDCWMNKWKCNLANPKQWVDISFILFSFLARNIVTINNIIMINVNNVIKAKQNLNANEVVGV
jgi:hypothetical protein